MNTEISQNKLLSSNNSNVRILCVGDMHLGRQPGHLPKELAEFGLEVRSLGPAEGWRRTVKRAIDLRVEAVVLLGDVVDKDNRFYEALGPLENGIKALAEANIPAFAVSGNHDGDVLSRLSQEIPSLHLLGRSSVWEMRDLECGVRLVGWSFTGTKCPNNPMLTFEAALAEMPDTNGLILGLLHCDLDVANSRYAPVSTSDFQNASVHAWLFGHIHKPHSLCENSRPLGYLGSLTPLDPTETGVHGPWLLKASGTIIDMEQIALAPLRWEEWEVSVDGLEDIEDFENIIVRSLNDLHEHISASLGDADIIGCRFRLIGRTRCFHALPTRFENGDAIPHRQIGDVYYFVDKIDYTGIRPALNLVSLAGGHDPPALLAGILLEIEGRTEKGKDLVQQALPSLQNQVERDAFIPVGRYRLEPEQAADILLQSGYYALEVLLAQKPHTPVTVQTVSPLSLEAAS